jgi:hypothetical protein
LTNLDVATTDNAAAVEHRYRRRIEVENIFRDSKHGAALRHCLPVIQTSTPPGCGVPCSRPPVAGWLHQLTATTTGEDIIAGHGVRDGKAIIATLAYRLIRVPARPIRHTRTLTLRLPPGHNLLAEILTPLRAPPALP